MSCRPGPPRPRAAPSYRTGRYGAPGGRAYRKATARRRAIAAPRGTPVPLRPRGQTTVAASRSRLGRRRLERADSFIPQGVVATAAERGGDAVANQPAPIDTFVGDVVIAHHAAEVAEAIAHGERGEE